MRGYSIDKNDYLLRLRKIEGQVRGLQRMVDDDEYCIDIITQVGSVTGAPKGVALGLVDRHLRHCVMQAAAETEGDPAVKLPRRRGRSSVFYERERSSKTGCVSAARANASADALVESRSVRRNTNPATGRARRGPMTRRSVSATSSLGTSAAVKAKV